MKVLVATRRTQGQRDSDFAWCADGELVTLAGVCTRDEIEGPDGGCGCARSFSGLESAKGVTTAEVRDDGEFTRDDLERAVRAFRDRGGWTELAGDKAGQMLADEVTVLAEIAASFPAGAVLERKERIRARIR